MFLDSPMVQEKLAELRKPESGEHAPDPEQMVTQGMELMEDLMKRTLVCTKAEETKEKIFPAEGKKLSKDAKDFVDRLRTCRADLTKLEEDLAVELNKFSIDVKYFADYQVPTVL